MKHKWFRRSVLFSAFMLMMLMLSGCEGNYFVLDPKGPVAETQLRLIVISVVLSAIVVIPVLIIMAYVVWRYRDKPDNKAPYSPNWNDSKVLEIIWWGIPIVIIGILGAYTARDTFALAKPPVSDTKPIKIQVTSLDWKWLFTYPEQHIATVNYVQIPAGVPVYFELTSDAPMNSFWVPELGGQEYAMPGMAVQLWLQANKPGNYYGTGANFSGKDFAHMRFNVEAKPQSEFNEWAKKLQQSNNPLTEDGYKKLAEPGTSDQLFFSSFPEDLFNKIVDKNGGKYMMHHNSVKADNGMPDPATNESSSNETTNHDDMKDMK